MSRFNKWRSALLAFFALSPFIHISAVENGNNKTNVFQASEYEINWVLPDGLKNGGILSITLHEPIFIVGDSKFLFETHFRYEEWLQTAKLDLQVIQNPAKGEWTIVADMSKENKEDLYEYIDMFVFSLDAKSFESFNNPGKYNDKITMLIKVSGIDNIKTLDNDMTTEIFDLNGNRMPEIGLKPGIYVIREGSNCRKQIIN